MGKRITPKLLRIENNHPIEEGTDDKFLYLLKNALLLSLKEQNLLNEQQYHSAKKKLEALSQ